MAGPYAPTGFRAEIIPQTAGFPGLQALQNNFREWYSWAVVASIAGAAGLYCHVPAIDGNKTDVRIETVSTWNGKQRSIRLQLKASSSLGTATDNGIDYVTKSFEREYYDAMQEPATIPLFLVLIALPPLTAPWTRVRQGIHAMHSAAWWGAVTDPSNEMANQTVRIPASQRLDLTGLQAMLLQA
ncbi:DUF4365 domain-containing protein [Conexibacter woesei]|uniref:DUF4365 domain-containing protein n=1 Tax=Conexibacter woesei (strain DSM 14684 / CCUG 47730 / CIP 108061 / JCM 11494 / NBRC 100937 / ID131577) TaxID=469383 RepID=D3F468_CONWI|nr:DUF4365 domain-containing protein [Conexibacter woesei]ADB50440.1 hypothetical protein Cwoe_2014 [Conexibacter woesei DSM 14684]